MTRRAGDRRPSPPPPRRRARSLAGATLLGIGLVLAPPLLVLPAHAGNLAVIITSPSDGRVFGTSTSVSVSGEVGTGLLASVESITVRLYRGGTQIDQETVCAQCGSDPAVPFSYTSPPLDENGQYSVNVTATGYLLANGIRVADASDEVGFAMAIPPAAPTNVTASHADGKVTVTWSPGGSYPDLHGYVVYRKTGSADFTPVSAGLPPSATSFVDSSPPPGGGNVQYRVIAIREGPTPGVDNWLTAESEGAVVTLPAPPTTSPTGQDGGTTTTVQPGGGLQPDGAVNNLGNLGNLFPSAAGLPFPTSASNPPALPDGGFSDTLPFGAQAASDNILGGTGNNSSNNKVDGRNPGRPSSSSGTGEIDTGDLSDTNRRALLIPVAAGSVLCVSALHLRWLNRRLAASAIVGGPGGGVGLEPSDLEPADPDAQPVTRRSDLISVG